MRFKILFILFTLATWSFAANPYLPFSVDFEKSGEDPQFNIQSRVLSTPVLRFYTFQGTNVFDPSGYVSTFSFSEDWNATNMVEITGSNYSSYIDFIVASNSFAYPIDKWYASVLLTKPADGGTYAWAYGYISLKPSPEANANGSFFYTRAINGSEYGPFTGSFSNWPFALVGDYDGYVKVPVFNATNLLFENRIHSNETDIVNIKLTNSIIQSNLTECESRVASNEVIGRLAMTNLVNAYAATGSASFVSNTLTITHGTNAGTLTNEPKWEAASNDISTKADNGQTAFGWGNHASAGYLSATQSIYSALTIGDRSQLGTNLSGLTQGIYTGSLTTVSYTGVTALVIGRVYAWGYTKIGSEGTSTLSIASHTLLATAAGATSNYFSFTGTDTNIVLKLDGDGMSICNVSNLYVKQITNGNMSVAEDFTVASKAIMDTVVLANKSEQTIGAGGTITPASNVKVNNTNGTVIALGYPQIATNGIMDGTMMFLKGASSTGEIQFTNGAGIKLDCDLGFLLKPDDVLQFVFLDGQWREVKRIDK